MWSDADLATIRRFYARQILFAARVTSPALERAFSAVPRERFLGDPPWKIIRWPVSAEPPDAEPDWLYADVMVGIIPEIGLNNGLPSAHAAWMHAAEVSPGEHVVHVGAGTGYYTAILAELTGPSGRVTALEHNAGLAERAARNLSGYPQVTVARVEGPDAPFDPADLIYVSAGATRPLPVWLDRLRTGGRLVVPLTADKPPRPGGAVPAAAYWFTGAVFCIKRDDAGFSARPVTPASFIPGEGMRDPASEAALAAGLENGRMFEVTRLYVGEEAAALPPERCWARAEGWALAYE